jgi:hypothetical protein
MELDHGRTPPSSDERSSAPFHSSQGNAQVGHARQSNMSAFESIAAQEYGHFPPNVGSVADHYNAGEPHGHDRAFSLDRLGALDEMTRKCAKAQSSALLNDLAVVFECWYGDVTQLRGEDAGRVVDILQNVSAPIHASTSV